jgi:hypothetical protein
MKRCLVWGLVSRLETTSHEDRKYPQPADCSARKLEAMMFLDQDSNHSLRFVLNHGTQ